MIWKDAWWLSKKALQKFWIGNIPIWLMTFLLLNPIFQIRLFDIHLTSNIGVNFIVFFFDTLVLISIALLPAQLIMNKHLDFIRYSYRKEFYFLHTMPLNSQSILLSRLIYMNIAMIFIYGISIPILYDVYHPNHFTLTGVILLVFIFMGLSMLVIGPILYWTIFSSQNIIWICIGYITGLTLLLSSLQSIFSFYFLGKVRYWIEEQQVLYPICILLLGYLILFGWFMIIQSKWKKI
ncbi:hypothetical protein [Thermoflavimicrobium daqui]|uniref:Uncharacterized protein n=1 Tax=Thermoflavimicrobium daqui TaxID=2137476 RepID=A0A364K337_9BACL|nr:hypothetical protein [Thermoflavimicrobium daqui]RAL23249.1 hypothetical protein DL897_12875 [Thermoflavimicrobium daqui]